MIVGGRLGKTGSTTFLDGSYMNTMLVILELEGLGLRGTMQVLNREGGVTEREDIVRRHMYAALVLVMFRGGRTFLIVDSGFRRMEKTLKLIGLGERRGEEGGIVNNELPLMKPWIGVLLRVVKEHTVPINLGNRTEFGNNGPGKRKSRTSVDSRSFG